MALPPPLPPRQRPRSRVPYPPLVPPISSAPGGLPLLIPRRIKPTPSSKKNTNAISHPHLIDCHVNPSQQSEKLANLALRCGGAQVKKFSQGSYDTRYGLGYWFRDPSFTPNGQSWGGLCKGMAVYWIYCHAKERDFWSWLIGPNDEVILSSAIYLTNLQASYIGVCNADFLSSYELGIDGDQWVDTIFEVFGMKPSTGITPGSNSSTTPLSYSVATNAREMAMRLVENSGHYKQFSFRSPNQGHAVALWVDDDVTFFDPNFGEFWFPKKQSFALWFELFWRETYGAMFTSNFYISTWSA
ncbi:YopT-type cysteine protease domain-containing protein [Pelagibaculum spongiae]|uniref:Peptidase C58 YopT-type domain-containing protein n=1 Tax=Pelagibaculum spongiae TaxID=2080658 RepID=A0A2V1H269_9GAMM|nr:YopT-type cysteine protease domain-containing protein [Pelagibaculum spongiae]PVZ69770.1 hypothetical protein DC094_10765 [Pelagibaculum spongiae]